MTLSVYFGLSLTLGAYALGVLVQKKTKLLILHPLLIAVALIIAVLEIFHIPVAHYQEGAALVRNMLTPATAVLALNVYNQRKTLGRAFLPVVGGCLAGSLASMGSVYLLCRLFGLDDVLTATLLPKSVTTPIAMSIAGSLGGIVPITVAAVILTGIIGALLAPALCRLLRIHDPVVQGVAIGTSSHAIGTTRALEMGDVQGAMSSVSIGVAGILTSLLALLI